MRKLIILLLILLSGRLFAQADSSRWLRAFPITDYMVPLNDSVKVVQLEMPDYVRIKDAQLGILYGVGGREEAVQKGYGRCHLIKGDYSYFAIGHNESGHVIKQGDLIYTYMDKSSIHYERIAALAGHFIQLQNVYEKPFYDRYLVFQKWTMANENDLMDSLIADIRFTGSYYLNNDPSMDKQVTKGYYQGGKILSIMAECSVTDIKNFLDYIIAKPRLYAGKQWKMSEIFATWVSEGAPMVLKDK